MRAHEIPLAEYMNPAHQWTQYRSVSSAEIAEWYAERLPSEAESEFAIVNRGTYWTIARRTCHLFERP